MSNHLLDLGITYRAFVAGLFAKKCEGAEGLMHAAAGIAGEGGEILDEIKKHWVYGKPLNREKVLEEIGDDLFYITALCNLLGVTLSECIDGNVEKLMKRYPNGYSDRAAIERVDVTSSSEVRYGKITCYDRDEAPCTDPICLTTGCRLLNAQRA